MKSLLNRKNFYSLAILLVSIAAIASSCATPQNSSTNTSLNTAAQNDKWVQIFKNAGYTSKPSLNNESAIELIRNLPESMQAIAGTVTNPLGIRDDILEYTLATFKDNPKALSAAIAYAQYDYWISLAYNKQSARKYYQAMGYAIWCVDYFADFQTGLKYSRNLAKLLRDIPAREKHEHFVEANYLSPGIYGFGNLSDKELAQKCEQGNY